MTRPSWRQALDTLGEAIRFFGRNYPVVFGFGVLASIQRAGSVLFGDQLPAAANLAGEVFTLGVRAAFVAWLGWRLLAREPEGSSFPESARRIGRGLVASWRVQLWHAGYLLALTLIFNNLLEGVGPLLVPASAQDLFWAALLAIKNVTIIPFCMIWLIMILRRALRGAAATPRPAPESVRPRS